jgi:hypothetical protein
MGAQLSEVLNAEVTSSEEGGFSRRRVVKGVAWSVPVIVAAVGAPPAAASPGPTPPPTPTVSFSVEGATLTFPPGTNGKAPAGSGPTAFNFTNTPTTFAGNITITPVGTVRAKLGIQKIAPFDTTTYDGHVSTTSFSHTGGQPVTFDLTLLEDAPPNKPKSGVPYSYTVTVTITISGKSYQDTSSLTVTFP